jgi:hypothetical protein
MPAAILARRACRYRGDHGGGARVGQLHRALRRQLKNRFLVMSFDHALTKSVHSAPAPAPHPRATERECENRRGDFGARALGQTIHHSRQHSHTGQSLVLIVLFCYQIVKPGDYP